MAVASGGVPLDMEPVVRQGICAWSVCIPEQTINLAVIMVFSVVGLLLLVGLAYIQQGHEALRQEREETVAEQRAFREFATKVSQLQAQPAHQRSPAVSANGGTSAKGPPASLIPTPPEDELHAVTDAYRETVMAVSHYETEYDEPLRTNMAAELSPEVANAVTDQTGTLTPRLQKALIALSMEAADQRDQLLDLIDAEESALDRLECRLMECEEAIAELESASFPTWSYDRLQEAFEDVRGLQDRIDDLVVLRQEEIRGTSTPNGVDGTDARDFLYRAIDVTHPVLAQATALHERASTIEDEIVGGILQQS